MSKDNKVELQAELDTYNAELPRLLADAGKYVLIHDGKVQGVFIAYEDALVAGYKSCGVKPFLVKRIEEMPSVQFFTRDILPCHS